MFTARTANELNLVFGIVFKRLLYALHGCNEIRCYRNIYGLGESPSTVAQANRQSTAAYALFNYSMENISIVI
jgi:hypothetical protein